jgi:hypothetical protein
LIYVTRATVQKECPPGGESADPGFEEKSFLVTNISRESFVKADDDDYEIDIYADRFLTDTEAEADSTTLAKAKEVAKYHDVDDNQIHYSGDDKAGKGTSNPATDQNTVGETEQLVDDDLVDYSDEEEEEAGRATFKPMEAADKGAEDDEIDYSDDETENNTVHPTKASPFIEYTEEEVDAWGKRMPDDCPSQITGVPATIASALPSLDRARTTESSKPQTGVVRPILTLTGPSRRLEASRYCAHHHSRNASVESIVATAIHTPLNFAPPEVPSYVSPDIDTIMSNDGAVKTERNELPTKPAHVASAPAWLEDTELGAGQRTF